MYLTLAIVVAGLVVLAAAAPQPTSQRNGTAISITKHSQVVIRNEDQTVNFDALNSHVASVKAILRGLENYERNTGKSHSLKGIEKRDYGDPQTYSNEFYYGAVMVGYPAISFNVVFDTLCSDLFIPMVRCDSTCNGHTLWQPLYSGSAVDTGQTSNINLGDGLSASVEIYTDIIAVGNLMTGESQVLGAATHYSAGLESPGFPADGLLGLAFPSAAVYTPTPLFQTLLSDGELTEQVFSFKLEHSGGELYIGGTNPALYTGEFTYVSISVDPPPAFWEFTVDNVRGDGSTLLNNIFVVIDTSSYLLTGPFSDVATLHSGLGGQPVPGSQAHYSLPCNSLQTIYFTISGTPIPVPPSSYNLGPLPSNPSECLTAFVGSDLGFWIVGNALLQNVYTTFDFANNRIGFAQLA